jgi:DNA-binding CsgD family transcriptional regulator
MVVIRNPQIITNKAMIYSLRSEGLTLREIGEKFGISRERVRKIISIAIGSTKHDMLSTHQLIAKAGLSGRYIMQLRQHGIITPSHGWEVKGANRFVWSIDTVTLARSGD